MDSNGCIATTNDTIIMHTNPIASFSIDSTACGPDTLTPTDNSLYADQWLWEVSYQMLV